MRINLSITLSFLACQFIAQASAAPGVSAITSSLSVISNQLTTLNDTLNNFNGGLVDSLIALQIQGESTLLVGEINHATAVVNAASQLNETDSFTVAEAVAVLEPVIFSVLDNLIARHSLFEVAILDVLSATFLVEDDLKSQKSATDALGAAITSKLATDLQSLGPLIIAQIDAAFEQAISVYSS